VRQGDGDINRRAEIDDARRIQGELQLRRAFAAFS
jgi:hypothetical protein